MAPKPPSRADVERTLAGTRTKVLGLSPASSRKAALTQLGKLEDRLRKNEAPAVIARDLEKLTRDLGL